MPLNLLVELFVFFVELRRCEHMRKSIWWPSDWIQLIQFDYFTEFRFILATMILFSYILIYLPNAHILLHVCLFICSEKIGLSFISLAVAHFDSLMWNTICAMIMWFHLNRRHSWVRWKIIRLQEYHMFAN